MKRCVVLDDYQRVAARFGDWARIADRVSMTALHDHLDGDALVAALAGADIVVAMRERTPFDAALLDRLPSLRLLATSGMRNAAIDIAAARARGVTVAGTSSRTAPAMELTWALILGLARHLATESASLRADGRWQNTIGTDLAGRTIGIVGLGRIGSQVARVANAFDMHVIAWSPHLTGARAAECGARRMPAKESLLELADIVTLHMVHAPDTSGMVGDAELRLMRPGALLINTSRAGLVDQPALIAALQEGRLGGAGLDVFDAEPLPAGHPFRTLPNVLATPHLGYVTEANYRAYFGEAIEDIEAWLDGREMRVLSPPLPSGPTAAG